MTDEPALTIRPSYEKDMPFVFATWMKSRINMNRRHKMPLSRVIHFRKVYVNKIISSGAKVKVLCSAESTDTLHGWVATIDSGVGWVYVIPPLRQLGYAKKLIDASVGYGDTVKVFYPWPHEGERFQYEGSYNL